MKSMSASDARQNLPEIINQVAFTKKRIVLTKHGKKLVAVIPLEDLETLEALENMAFQKQSDKLAFRPR